MDVVGGDEQLDRVAVLHDPTRRALYRYVSRSDEPVGREDAAGAVGVSASLAAFHLDKLVAAGLLRTSFRRLTGRSGPGAGRPAKLYERSDEELSVALPARQYELAARLLLDAVDAGNGSRLGAAARELGHRTGAADAAANGKPRSRRTSLARLEPLLEDLGYEPAPDDGSIVLRNCPFHALAQQSTTLICGMNVDLVGGLLDGLGARRLAAELAPEPGRCCVVVRPSRTA